MITITFASAVASAIHTQQGREKNVVCSVQPWSAIQADRCPHKGFDDDDGDDDIPLCLCASMLRSSAAAASAARSDPPRSSHVFGIRPR